MADEKPPERNVNIQNTVNVGTANDSKVSGAKVSVGSARDVHVHGDTTPPPSFRSVALVGVLAFLGTVFLSYAVSIPLPDSLKPYLWLSWPLALLGAAISIWVAYRQSRSISSSVAIGGSLEQRNRVRMLDKVETYWVKGVLEQSLYQIARIELGLEYDPSAVTHPWESVVQRPGQPNRFITAGKPVIEVFDELGGELLILGAPGAGKTTLLLELTCDLIARARQNEQHTIPVVFNLSTWVAKQPLNKWLAEELNQRYSVPHKLAQQWVEANTILPLLDGLDEVVVKQQNACVDAINEYRRIRGFVSLVVSSRIDDYAALIGKLRLEGAIVIQPLTRQQVDRYLRLKSLAGVRALLRDDSLLGELLDTPLMLSITVITYKNHSPSKLREIGTINERRQQLFDDYIQVMLTRRTKDVRYTQQQIYDWLGQIAQLTFMVSVFSTKDLLSVDMQRFIINERFGIDIIDLSIRSGYLGTFESSRDLIAYMRFFHSVYRKVIPKYQQAQNPRDNNKKNRKLILEFLKDLYYFT